MRNFSVITSIMISLSALPGGADLLSAAVPAFAVIGEDDVMTGVLPTHAKVVVIGGGVVGASVAYHLAAAGCRATVLVERAKIGSGTSWHAAGNMETYRADPLIGEMIRYAVALYPRLEAETGQALGWRQTGRVMFTASPERMAQYRGLPALGRARGIEIAVLSPGEVAARLPIVSPDGLAGGVWIPSDGRINPTDLAMAFARGARMKGAAIVEDCPVTGMALENGRVSGVTTPQGEIRCEAVVIASGLWSPHLGAMIGVVIPLHAVQHLYILTKPIAGVSRELPLFLSYDERLYGREDVGGLLIGFFDAKAIPVAPADLPKDFSFGLLDANWTQVAPNMAIALNRFPVLQTAEVRLLLNGPESFTPDMQMLLGQAPCVEGCFVATGMNSSGIALSAAAGRLTAEWILDGRPSLDATRLDIRRFAASQGVGRYLRNRASEVVTHMCRMATPELDFADTRAIRRSPLHSALEARGARFASVMQWERPLRFGVADESAAPRDVAGELAAAENGVALFDRSSDAKLRLDGPRAETLLNRLSGAVAGMKEGENRVAPMLNSRGGVEVLPTVARVGQESWLLLAEAAQATRLADWVSRHRPRNGTSLADVTSAYGAMVLVGPMGAGLLARLGCDVGDDALHLREAEIGYASAMLFPQLGPPGTYILVSTETSLHVYESLDQAGGEFDLRLAGAFAEEQLLLKHAVPRFGREVTPFRSAVASGIDGGLDPAANAKFIGRAALLRDRRRPPKAAIRLFILPGAEPLSLANAPVVSGDKTVGHVTSAAAILAMGRSLAFCLVEQSEAKTGYHVIADGRSIPIEPYAAPSGKG